MNRFALVCACLVLTGCAAGHAYRPTVDSASVDDWNLYEQDLADCQAYARRVDPARNAVVGAFVGALVGAAIGASIGDSELARDGARIGAVAGAVDGGAEGAQTQVDIIRHCMSHRGYAVLY